MRLTTRWLASPVLTLLLFTPLPRPARAAPSEADSAYGAYRIPAHRWTQISADLSGGGSHRSANADGGFEQRRGEIRGVIGGRVVWGFDSDPSLLAVGLSADVDAQRTHYESVFQYPAQVSDRDDVFEQILERVSLSGSWRRYPWAAPLAFTLATNNLYTLTQRFQTGTTLYTYPSSTSKSLSSTGYGEWAYQGMLSAGTGFGRVRDVTPVYQAQVLEDRLRRTGALSRPLSHAARERLAALFTTQGDVSFAHQRPDKYFWEALERILREDGALERGTLDAYSAQRVLEPIVPTGGVFRRRGFFVGPAVVVATNRAHWREEQSNSFLHYVGDSLDFSSEFTSDVAESYRTDDIFTSLLAEYHRPLGLRWQVGASHSTSIGEAGETLATFTSLSASYLVSDRWVGGVSAVHVLSATERGSARTVDRWRVAVNAELQYFLEDSWALRLRASQIQDHTSRIFTRLGSVDIGISRIFTGLFELPGVAAAMRAAPPTR